LCNCFPGEGDELFNVVLLGFKNFQLAFKSLLFVKSGVIENCLDFFQRKFKLAEEQD